MRTADHLPDTLDTRTGALTALHAAGAHFVLTRNDKAAIWREWQLERPPLDAVLDHLGSGLVALIPHSLGLTALDVDEGDADEIVNAHPPRVVLRSRKVGGRHLYYDDPTPRRNANFGYRGCTGQVRSANGYIILWHHEVCRLAKSLLNGPPGQHPIPPDFYGPDGNPVKDSTTTATTRRPRSQRRTTTPKERDNKQAAARRFVPRKLRQHGFKDGHPRPLSPKNGEHPDTAKRVSPKTAFRKRHQIELNPPNQTNAIIVTLSQHTIDRFGLPFTPHWSDDAKADEPPTSFTLTDNYDSAPEPNWGVAVPGEGMHLGYSLAIGVQHNPNSRKGPQDFLADVCEKLRAAWGADSTINPPLTFNPVKPPPGSVTSWTRREPYTLGELNRCLPKSTRPRWRKSRRRHRYPQADDSRNCNLFELVNRLAFKREFAEAVLDGRKDWRAIRKLLDTHNAEVSARLGKPAIETDAELNRIARSIEQRIHVHWSDKVARRIARLFSAQQRQRGAKGLHAVRLRRAKRNRRFRKQRHKGWSVPEINAHAAQNDEFVEAGLLVSDRQIYRICATDSDGLEGFPVQDSPPASVDSVGASGGHCDSFPHVSVVARLLAPHKQCHGTCQYCRQRGGKSPPRGAERGQNGAVWPPPRPPTPQTRPRPRPHTQTIDQLNNERRRVASDLVGQARALLTRLEADGDAEGLARARRMLRESYGIDHARLRP